MKKTILIPAGIAEKIIHFKPENRLLSAIGQFSPERRNFWHPVQSYYLTNESICEANAFFSPASQVCTAQRTGHAPFLRGQSRCSSAGFLVPDLRFCTLRHGE